MSMERYVFIVSAEKGKADCGKAVISSRITEYFELVRKNEAAIKSFLKTCRIMSESVVLPAYYGELLAWALKRHLERKHWQIVRVLGCRHSEPEYANINTDFHKNEELLLDGQLLINNVNNGNHRLVITVDAGTCSNSLVRVEGNNKREIKEFADGIKTIAEKENYYRHKKFAFNGRIRFMDVCDEQWGNIKLAPAVKEQIKASTINLLKKKQTHTKHGLPLKRCVLLTGGADKDKEAICIALIAEASGVTCITADASELDYGCITELYHLARDLSPCIVFIMNIDRFSQKRMKPGCQQGEPLISLLTILGSVEEYERIVTVATASSKNTLSEAMLC